MTQGINTLSNLIEPAVEAMGFELVGCEISHQGKRVILQVFIDSEHGVSIDDCGRVSRQISALLDVEDPIHSHYDLEVSSPGLARPLFKLAHYQRFLGREVKIRLRQPVEGERRNYRGVLLSADVETITLGVDGENVSIPMGYIEKANLVPEI